MTLVSAISVLLGRTFLNFWRRTFPKISHGCSAPMLDCPSLLTGLATIPLTTSSAAALICSVAMFSAPDPWTLDMFNITDFFVPTFYILQTSCVVQQNNIIHCLKDSNSWCYFYQLPKQHYPSSPAKGSASFHHESGSTKWHI